MGKVTLEREVISPKQAREYLEANMHNRNLRQLRVQQLKGAIERGEWRETGDPIKFNGDGTLIDGQHRLEAIARGSKRVTVWVARGVEMAAQEVIDTGSKRTIGDVLTLRGYSNAALLGAVAGVVWNYRDSGEFLATGGANRPTVQQMLKVVEDEPVLTDRAAAAAAFGRADRALRIPASLVGAFLHIFGEHSSDEDAAAFFEQLLSPRSQLDPTAVLRRRLLQESAHQTIPLRMKTAMVVKAWNAWIRGERPRRITWRSGGATTEDFPVVQGPAE